MRIKGIAILVRFDMFLVSFRLATLLNDTWKLTMLRCRQTLRRHKTGDQENSISVLLEETSDLSKQVINNLKSRNLIGQLSEHMIQ